MLWRQKFSFLLLVYFLRYSQVYAFSSFSFSAVLHSLHPSSYLSLCSFFLSCILSSCSSPNSRLPRVLPSIRTNIYWSSINGKVLIQQRPIQFLPTHWNEFLQTLKRDFVHQTAEFAHVLLKYWNLTLKESSISQCKSWSPILLGAPKIPRWFARPIYSYLKPWTNWTLKMIEDWSFSWVVIHDSCQNSEKNYDFPQKIREVVTLMEPSMQ